MGRQSRTSGCSKAVSVSYLSPVYCLYTWLPNSRHGILLINHRPRCRRNIKVFSLVAAYTIEHGENKSTGPDLMISYHDNDHYNSLRDSKATKPTCKPVKIMPVRPFLSTPTTAKIEEESTSSESKTSSNGRTRTSRAKTTKEIESPTLGKMEKRTNKAAKKGATGKSESQKPSVGVRKSRRVAGETTIAAVVETTASTLGKSKDKADKKLVVTKSVKKPARRNGKNGTNKESMSKPGQPQVQIEASANMDVDEPTLKKRSASVGSSSQLSGLAASIRSSTKDVEVDPAFNLSDEDLAFAFDKEDKISDTINNSAILAGSTVTKPPIQAFDMDFEPELDEIAVPTGLAAHDELASDSELQSLSSTSTLEDSRNGTSLGESKKNKRLSERVKCFSEDEEDDQDYMALTKPSSESVEKPSTAKKNKKGGKCPCGSGKTYRKCCKEKEKKEKAAMRRSSSIVTDDDDESSSQPKEHEMESGFRVLKI
jgi:hypothetical protein